jgi:hypothetical protein
MEINPFNETADIISCVIDFLSVRELHESCVLLLSRLWRRQCWQHLMRHPSQVKKATKHALKIDSVDLLVTILMARLGTDTEEQLCDCSLLAELSFELFRFACRYNAIRIVKKILDIYGEAYGMIEARDFDALRAAATHRPAELLRLLLPFVPLPSDAQIPIPLALAKIVCTAVHKNNKSALEALFEHVALTD